MILTGAISVTNGAIPWERCLNVGCCEQTLTIELKVNSRSLQGQMTDDARGTIRLLYCITSGTTYTMTLDSVGRDDEYDHSATSASRPVSVHNLLDAHLFHYCAGPSTTAFRSLHCQLAEMSLNFLNLKLEFAMVIEMHQQL